MKYPAALQELIEAFRMLPSVGPKTAERYAFHVITKMQKEQAVDFTNKMLSAIDSIRKCSVCGNLSDKDVCDICTDENRDNTIMVVESSKEVNVFEKTNEYKGKYHVLNGLISPMNGVGPEDINFTSLLRRIDEEKISKIIIATSANLPGEMTSMFIKNSLENKKIEIYRIGYGLPVGADIEYADEVTLMKALQGITKY